jgi:hypothetical protein
MPNTKPIRPYQVAVKAEGTAFSFEAFAVTDFIRAYESSIGDSIQPQERHKLTCSHRGQTPFRTRGPFNDVPWSLSIPFYGRGAAGTALTPRKALFESAAGWSEVVAGGTSVTYESDTSNPSAAVSMYRVDREQQLGEYIMGAIADTFSIELNKEGQLQMTFSGMAARKWEFNHTTLGAQLDDQAGTVAMTLANPDRLRTGENSASITGLEIYVTIDSEIIKITSINTSTGVCVIEREMFGTSAAAHSNSTDVYPAAPTATYAEDNGLLLGSQDWSVSDGSAINMRSLSISVATGRAYDQKQTGSTSSNSMHNNGIVGSGSFTAILNNARAEHFKAIDTATLQDLAITLGSTAGSIFTINLDRVLYKDEVPKDLPEEGVFEFTLNFELEDTAAALGGQVQIVET